MDFLDSDSYVVLVKDDIYAFQKFLNSGTSHVWSKNFAQDMISEPILKVIDDRIYIFVSESSLKQIQVSSLDFDGVYHSYKLLNSDAAPVTS